jgi:type IV pilus assembly protein PilV
MSTVKTLQSGFSLLEALLAVVILSIGLMGLAGMQMANLKTIHNSTQKQQATILLNDLTARVRNNFIGAKAGDYNDTAVTCGSPPSNTCTTTSCSHTELAKMDLYQVLCGDGGSNVGIKNSLTNGQLAITCATNCTQAVNIRLRWDERISQKNKSQESTTSTPHASEFKSFELTSQIVVRNI